MKSKYYILKITEWGVEFIDDNLKLRNMNINDYVKYCCE